MIQLSLLKLTPTVAKSSENEPLKDGSTTCKCGKATFENSMEGRGPEKLTAWLAASHAQTFQSPAKVPGSKGPNPACGERWPESLAKFDLASFLWKTAQCLLAGGLAEYSETWPRSGSMRNGIVFRRTRWERHTCGKECLFWPTPVASDRNGYKCNRGKKNLSSMRLNHWLYLNGRSDLAHSPMFRERMMGWPKNWTELKQSGTGNVHSLRPSLGENCMEGLIVDSMTTK